jgi:phosphotransferase system HPr (HPr) family protein
MTETTATIQNRDGIHCRPATLIVKAMLGYEGNILVFNDRGESDLRSILSLMALQLFPGDTLTIQVTGPNEEEQCETVRRLFETHFDFPPQEDALPS